MPELLDSNSHSPAVVGDRTASPVENPANSANIPEGLNPDHTLGLSETSVGSNEIEWDTNSNPKPAFQTKNADSAAPKKAMRQMGHSDPMDDLKALHASHDPSFDEMGLELSDLQLRAIDLTLKGHTDVDVAKMLEINRRTLWKWKSSPGEYREYLEKCRAERFVTVALRYQGVLNRAAVVLNGLLDDPDQKNRLCAAQSLARLFGWLRPRK